METEWDLDRVKLNGSLGLRRQWKKMMKQIAKGEGQCRNNIVQSSDIIYSMFVFFQYIKNAKECTVTVRKHEKF